MQTQDYPLIFIVEDNFIYNRLIESHLRSNKFIRIESFLSADECLKNLYKKPDIVIQDYLMNELSGNNILKASKNSNPNTEFVLLSGLDNFSKRNNPNTELISLSEPDNFDDAVSAIKYGAHDYVAKDLFALKNLLNDLNKIRKIQHIRLQNNQYKVCINLFFIEFVSLMMNLFGSRKHSLLT